jgi:hypothetical protein
MAVTILSHKLIIGKPLVLIRSTNAHIWAHVKEDPTRMIHVVKVIRGSFVLSATTTIRKLQQGANIVEQVS